MGKSNQDDSQIKWRERYQNLLDSLNVGFVLLDMEFRYLDVNKTYMKMTGLPREKLVGRHTKEFYSKDEFERLKEIVVPLRDYDDFQFEFALPNVNGERIPVVHNVHRNKDKHGSNASIHVLITDIREQKKVQEELESANKAIISSYDTLEKEKKKFEAILFGIGDCVTIFDPKETLLLCNPKGVEIRGKRRTPFLPLKSGTQQQIELTVGKENRQFFGQMQEIRDQRGAVFAYVETLKDITSQIMLKEKEHELSWIKREMRRSKLQTEMIGISRAMQKVFELILRCAEVDSTVLILGETGVGKEVAARAIHAHSSRKGKPFVAVNCGAIPDTLLESELFGHVKGAFTGAITKRPGLFQEAQGGTLFLDEVGDISSSLQVKLLRALQEKEIRPVGGDRAHPVDVRVITATNKDLEYLVKQKRFRHDLYYRIAVIPLIIPPLRERKDDIIPLAEHFIKKYRKSGTKTPKTIDHQVQQLFLNWSWPGNARELENAIEHCIAMSKNSSIKTECLPVNILNGFRPEKEDKSAINSAYVEEVAQGNRPSSSASPMKLEESEKIIISNALRLHNGNRTLTAKDLGISRSTILRKIKRYGIIP
ncbi:MAG: sigma 54-interacting transcriptional regulator [Deltaproteobacteria bacterium]|nr:sigma 54-interacting transcriptional regulator [Deltaproteobacteria bacterium]